VSPLNSVKQTAIKLKLLCTDRLETYSDIHYIIRLITFDNGGYAINGFSLVSSQK